jgi:hypothetical protein
VNLLPERSETAKRRQEQRERERIERNMGRVYRKHGPKEVIRRYGPEGLKYLQKKALLESPVSGQSESSEELEKPSKPPITGNPELDLEYGEVGETMGEKLGELLFGRKKKKS